VGMGFVVSVATSMSASSMGNLLWCWLHFLLLTYQEMLTNWWVWEHPSCLCNKLSSSLGGSSLGFWRN